MSIVSKIIGKRKTRTSPSKQYNNPKKDGLYRICFHCQNMFPISDELSKAALCWICTLKVIQSDHYLAKHITLPDYEYFPGIAPSGAKSDESEPSLKENKSKANPFGGGICECGEEFERKTNRQKRCEKCQMETRLKQVRDAVKKHKNAITD
jgi:hypothetical protein